jgi:hypothetical protein
VPAGLHVSIADATGAPLTSGVVPPPRWTVEAVMPAAGAATVAATADPMALLAADAVGLAARGMLVLLPALLWAWRRTPAAGIARGPQLPPVGPLDGAVDPLRLRRLLADAGPQRAVRQARAFARHAATAIARIDDRIGAGRGTEAHRLAVELSQAAQPFGLLALEDALDRLAEALAAGQPGPRDSALSDLLRQGPRIAADLEAGLAQPSVA